MLFPGIKVKVILTLGLHYFFGYDYFVILVKGTVKVSSFNLTNIAGIVSQFFPIHCILKASLKGDDFWQKQQRHYFIEQWQLLSLKRNKQFVSIPPLIN